jgi:adenine-specific DNA-methyltransferase
MPRPTPSKKVRLGQFYTSEYVTQLMVAMTDQNRDAAVLEAGYGEGAFLDALLKQGFSNVAGYDVDPENHRTVTELFGDAVDARCLNYLLAPRSELFDLIIGNPPYVQWNNIDPETRELLRDPFWTPFINGEWDLLYAFIIWSVEKLRSGGELIFIVPYNWFNATYASPVRQYLADNGSFEALVHFSEYKLFDDAAPNALIFKYRKGPRRFPYVKVAEFEGRRGNVEDLLTTARAGLKGLDGHTSQESRDGDWRFFSARHLAGNESWYLASPSEEELVTGLERGAPARLDEHFDIAVGVVSGYDEAFTISDEEFEQLPQSERAVVVEMVKASGCSRFRVLSASRFVFADEITSEDVLRAEYPALYQRLLPHRERLDHRYGAGGSKQWWHWATVRNLAVFQRNADAVKLFVPGIDRALRSRFCATNHPVLGAGDVICVARRKLEKNENEDMLYALGWLNSSAVNTWYRIKGARTGHRTRYTQAYVSQMPYRPIDFNDAEEVALHDRIVAAVREAMKSEPDSGARQRAEAEVDAAVAALVARR